MEKYPTVEEYEKYMKILKWRIDETFKNMRSLKKEIEVSNMPYRTKSRYKEPITGHTESYPCYNQGYPC